MVGIIYPLALVEIGLNVLLKFWGAMTDPEPLAPTGLVRYLVDINRNDKANFIAIDKRIWIQNTSQCHGY